MTDQPVREPIPPDPQRDRSDEPRFGVGDDASVEESSTRPSGPEGAEDDAGERAPRPSQAEGDRDGLGT